MSDELDQEEGEIARAIRRLVAKRAGSQHFLSRVAWTVMTMLSMTFGWVAFTLLVLSERHWTAAGMIGADGAVLLVGMVVLLMIWLLDE